MTNRPKSGRLTNRNLRFLSLSCKERGYTRQERPHGGYKGVSKQYPLSVYGFDKSADYMAGVKRCVKDHYEEEKKQKLKAPAWVSWANKVKNHTGEQALMVQKYLAGNKLEQTQGVVPTYTEKMRERCNSSAPKDPDTMLVKSNSTHQFLTSTDRYGESEELVDITLGRPTRASLLRVHHRSQSAPQVRAPIENKVFLHRQQMMAIKKDDKYKTADVPKELQPITQNGESIYEFLVGARYNRSYCTDSTCMSKLGLYVSKDDPLRCFLHRPFQSSPVAGKDTNHYNQHPQSSSASTKMLASQQSCETSPPLRVKFAWDKDESAVMSGRSTPSLTSTPRFNQGYSKEAATTSHGISDTLTWSGRSTPTLKPSARRNHSRGASNTSHATNKVEKDKKGHTHDDSYCIMCYGGMPKRPILSKNHNTKRKDQEDEHECLEHLNEDENWKRSYINILEQNYHLNITGTKVGFHNTKPSTPKGSLHHSSSSALYRQNKKSIRPYTNRNNNCSVQSLFSYNGSTAARSEFGSISELSSSGINVTIPVMPTSTEVDLPVQITSDTKICTCKVATEDGKEAVCQINVGLQKETKYLKSSPAVDGKEDSSGTLGNEQTLSSYVEGIERITIESSNHQKTAAECTKNGNQTIEVSKEEPVEVGSTVSEKQAESNKRETIHRNQKADINVEEKEPGKLTTVEDSKCFEEQINDSLKDGEYKLKQVSNNQPQIEGKKECENIVLAKDSSKVVMNADIQPHNAEECEKQITGVSVKDKQSKEIVLSENQAQIDKEKVPSGIQEADPEEKKKKPGEVVSDEQPQSNGAEEMIVS